jgi:hypothetical protein
VPQLVDGDISILNMQMILSYSWNLILQKLWIWSYTFPSLNNYLV